eukprot:Gb_29003 [translate_table: standard]
MRWTARKSRRRKARRSGVLGYCALRQWVRERGVLVRGGTRHTLFAFGAVVAVFTFRRADVLRVPTLPNAFANVSYFASLAFLVFLDAVVILVLSDVEFSMILCLQSSVYNWSAKAIRRKTTGTGRMRYLRHMPRRFKNNFREGTQATPRKKVAAASF